MVKTAKITQKRQQNATVNTLNSNVYDSLDDCEADKKRQSNATEMPK
jgi:hypothetical protein